MNERNDEKKQRRIRVGYIIGILAAILPLLNVIFNMLTALPPMKFDSIETEPASHIDFKTDSDALSPEPHIFEFYPFPSSPYFYVHFCTPGKHQNQSTAIINYETGKRVLQVECTYDMTHIQNRWKNYSHYKWIGASLIHDTPHVLMHRNERIIPWFIRPFSFLPDSISLFFHYPDKEIWAVDSNGETKKITNDRFLSFIPMGELFSYLSHRIVGRQAGSITEYQIVNDSLHEIETWPCDWVGRSPYRLPNGDYLITQKPEKDSIHYLLLRHSTPKSIRIEFQKHLKPKLPNYDAKLFIKEKIESGSLQYKKTNKSLPHYSEELIPLPATEDNTLFVLLNIPGNPIFEIKLDTLEENTPENAIHFKGYAKSLLPVFLYNNNQSLVTLGDSEYSASLMAHQPKITCRQFYLLDIESLPQKHSDSHTFKHAYRLPFPIHHISRMPLDENHFLAQGEDSFWKVRFDGQNFIPVFPKQGIPLSYDSYNDEDRKLFHGAPLKTIPENERARFY